MSSSSYVITGSKAQLGRCLVRSIRAGAERQLEAAWSHDDLDIADEEAVARRLDASNCAWELVHAGEYCSNYDTDISFGLFTPIALADCFDAVDASAERLRKDELALRQNWVDEEFESNVHRGRNCAGGVGRRCVVLVANLS